MAGYLIPGGALRFPDLGTERPVSFFDFVAVLLSGFVYTMRNPFALSGHPGDDTPREIFGYRIYLLAFSATWVSQERQAFDYRTQID